MMEPGYLIANDKIGNIYILTNKWLCNYKDRKCDKE